MTQTGFRDLIREISPPWLQRKWGERFLYAPGLILDGVMHWALEGMKARFPDKGPPEALALIGRDRLILRGFNEPAESYRARLKRWRIDWRRAGVAFALLEQVKAYLFGFDVLMRTVNTKGTWQTVAIDGTYAIVRKAGNWDWDGAPATQWSRFWVILYPPAGLWVVAAQWDEPGTTWDADATTCWDTTATVEQANSIRQIVATGGPLAWKPAGTTCVEIILAFDGASFDPSGPPGPPLPDGDWKYFSRNVGGTQVESRLGSARYWRGNV